MLSPSPNHAPFLALFHCRNGDRMCSRSCGAIHIPVSAIARCCGVAEMVIDQPAGVNLPALSHRLVTIRSSIHLSVCISKSASAWSSQCVSGYFCCTSSSNVWSSGVTAIFLSLGAVALWRRVSRVNVSSKRCMLLT